MRQMASRCNRRRVAGSETRTLIASMVTVVFRLTVHQRQPYSARHRQPFAGSQLFATNSEDSQCFLKVQFSLKRDRCFWFGGCPGRSSEFGRGGGFQTMWSLVLSYRRHDTPRTLWNRTLRLSSGRACARTTFSTAPATLSSSCSVEMFSVSLPETGLAG